jgi:hypothetical protein
MASFYRDLYRVEVGRGHDCPAHRARIPANVSAASSLHSGDVVLVGGHREAGRGVSESFADDLDRHAGFEKQRGVGVSQVVEADARKTGSVHELLEPVREQLWMCRLSAGSGEDVSV